MWPCCFPSSQRAGSEERTRHCKTHWNRSPGHWTQLEKRVGQRMRVHSGAAGSPNSACHAVLVPICLSEMPYCCRMRLLRIRRPSSTPPLSMMRFYVYRRPRRPANTVFRASRYARTSIPWAINVLRSTRGNVQHPRALLVNVTAEAGYTPLCRRLSGSSLDATRRPS